jgi:hypothetical protein
VQVACACEKVLREHDDVPTLVRIVDTYTIDPPPAPPAGVPVSYVLPLTIFLSLKSGDVVGDHAIGVRLTYPSGKSSDVREWPVSFGGGEHGAHVQIAFALQMPEVGLYWFDVLWGEDVLTRIPLRVRTRTSASSVAPNETESKPPMPS